MLFLLLVNNKKFSQQQVANETSCSDPSTHPSLLQPTHNIFPLSNLPGLIDAIILRGGRRAVDENTVPPGGKEEPKNWFYDVFSSKFYFISLLSFVYFSVCYLLRH
jgi:hypothetical protein